jgi:eukaryotic-like serine/threonine-protein kinase
MSQSFVCPDGHQWEDTWGDALSLAGEGTLPCPVCGAPTKIPGASEPTAPPVSLAKGYAWRDAPTIDKPTQATETSASPHSPPLDVPGYVLLSELGRGGMGVVYKARQEKLKRIVALKMILSGRHAATKELARFRSEAEAVARIQHPNIVQIYEVGEHEDRPYFSMEFVDGGCLLDRIHDHKLSTRDCGRMLAVLARAMHEVHEKGIIHRDLKPANVLLTRDGTPKVTDFGLAKELGEAAGHTRSGDVMGTPSYMAPEQAEGRLKLIGPHTDVYALGAILYEMLTARPPFKAETAMDTLMLVLYEDPMPPARLLPNCPRDLETICLKCLNKEIEKRYPTAKALAEDLERFIDGRPIEARPSTLTERLIKWARRRPAVAALAVVSVLATLVLLGVSLFYNVRLNQLNTELATTAEQKRLEAERAETKEKEANRRREEADLLREAADRQRRRAEDNFRKAREAVKVLLTEVAQNELANVPLMEDLRQRLLARAVAFHNQFVQQQSSDPSIRQQAGQAQSQLGEIYRLLGRYEQAEKTFQQSLARFEELAREFPNEPDYRRDLGLTQFHIGELARARGRPEDTKRAYDQAQATQAKLVSDFPKNPDYRYDLAHTLNDMALVQRSARQQDASAQLYQKAIAEQEALVKDYPAERPEFREDLAGSYNDLGALHHSLKKPGDAEKAYRTSLSRYEELVKQYPNTPAYKQKLAAVANNLGIVLTEQHGPAAGETLLREALTYREQLAKDFPSVLGYRQSVAQSRQNLGGLYAAEKKFPEAEKECLVGLEMQKKLAADYPEVPEFQGHLMEMLDNWAALQLTQNRLDKAMESLNQAQAILPTVKLKLGDNEDYRKLVRKHYLTRAETLLRTAEKEPAKHPDAARSAMELAKFTPDSAEDQRVTAIILARCSVLVIKDAKIPDAERKKQAESYANDAVAALGRSVKLGWSNAVELRTAAVWGPLRARPDFQKVLSEVESKGMN